LEDLINFVEDLIARNIDFWSQFRLLLEEIKV
jgi:hypothetical protein